MIGAALGPFAGGSLAQSFGYGALGIAAAVVGLTSAICFTLARASAATSGKAGLAAAG